MTEVYSAVQNGSLSLAAMGVRAVLEHVVVSKVGDQGTFKANLKAFETGGHIAPKDREVLEATLEVGHASIHRS